MAGYEEVRQVEWGSTWGELVDTQIRIGRVYQNVDADVYSAQLETYAKEPKKLSDLSCVKTGLGEYVMWYHADKTAFTPNSNYYLTFLWSYQGKTQVKRVPVRVEVGVK